ncbi:Hykk [Symbiodinium microadriaticum]|nr:Hykk [Symbiodinium microadriaticum]CAE7226058.1 Hykk [Symbiodinium sp. KB8]
MELMPLNTSSASTRFFWSNMDAERSGSPRRMASSSIDSRPPFSWPQVAEVARRFGEFQLEKSLPSERDLNFLLRSADAKGDLVVFKVHNPEDSRDFVECQCLALEYATARGASCQHLLRSQDTGEALLAMDLPEGGNEGRCFCRALSFLPGQMLADAAAEAGSDSGKLASLFAAVGEAVGSITAALQEFQHSAATREFVWDLQRCFEVVESHIGDVKEGQQQDLVRRVLDAQRLQLTSLLPKLRRSIVHNDPNDYNLVVGVDGRVGVLDFGDMLYSYTCSDAAIGMAYLFFHVPEDTPLAEGVRPFVEAYHQKCPLEEAEADALFALAVCRVCTSVCMSAYQSKLDPGNEYLLISAKPAWRLLERVDKFPGDAAKVALREACGFQAA